MQIVVTSFHNLRHSLANSVIVEVLDERSGECAHLALECLDNIYLLTYVDFFVFTFRAFFLVRFLHTQMYHDNDNDDYGFYCDEEGSSTTQACYEAHAFAEVLLNASVGKKSFGTTADAHTAVDPIRVVCDAFATDRALATGSPALKGRWSDEALPLAISRSRTSLDGFSTQTESKAFDLSTLSLNLPGPPDLTGSSTASSKNGSFELSVENDDKPEAPVWLVAQGAPEDLCERCRRRIVYSARHTQSGRVFSRSFPVSRPSSGSLRSANSSSASLRGSTTSSGSVGGRTKSTLRTPTASSSSSFDASAPLEFDRPTAAAFGGFRVVAGRFGVQTAEFELVVSSGATVYRAWRSQADMAALVEMVGVKRRAKHMPKANLAWEMVQRSSRWFKACDMLHLIEKRTMLDVFFEHLLYELDAPTHLLNFVDDATFRGLDCCECYSKGHMEGSRFTQTETSN